MQGSGAAVPQSRVDWQRLSLLCTARGWHQLQAAEGQLVPDVKCEGWPDGARDMWESHAWIGPPAALRQSVHCMQVGHKQFNK